MWISFGVILDAVWRRPSYTMKSPQSSPWEVLIFERIELAEVGGGQHLRKSNLKSINNLRVLGWGKLEGRWTSDDQYPERRNRCRSVWTHHRLSELPSDERLSFRMKHKFDLAACLEWLFTSRTISPTINTKCFKGDLRFVSRVIGRLPWWLLT